MNVNREMLAFLRKQYPVGTRIRLDSMQDPYAPVEAGTTGKLDCIDDAGQFHMKWDNGRTLALIPGVDSFTVLPPELSMTKLYMPLTAELYEPDVYGNMQEEPELLTGHDLTAYEDHIRSALVKYRMPEEVNRGIMHWYDELNSVNDKVRSVTFSVERRNGKLWGIAECQISGELSAAELTTLKEYIEGQASDGWGEGFEQHEIAVGRGSELYVHLWQDEDWSIQTEQERFCAHFEKLPEMCFTLLPGTGQLICIKRGESGYCPSDWSTERFPAILFPKQLQEAAQRRSERKPTVQITEAQKALRRLCNGRPSAAVESQVLSLLNSLAASPEQIEPQPQIVNRGELAEVERRFSAALTNSPVDENNAKELALRLAGMQYSAIGSSEYESQRLRHLFTSAAQMAEIDAELLKSTVSQVYVKKGQASLLLKNGQIIERS